MAGSISMGILLNACRTELNRSLANTTSLRASIRALLRFFYLVGFSFTCSPRIENWKGGRLIDGSDVVHPGGVGWDARYYGSSQVAAALLGSNLKLKEYNGF
ncbi:hypothetical protein F4802DRAFT_428036 [Xylaria palmicola]|nr:hypothetical protein F4802DRAFT_428036 [Xylaria palmicola]